MSACSLSFLCCSSQSRKKELLKIKFIIAIENIRRFLNQICNISQNLEFGKFVLPSQYLTWYFMSYNARLVIDSVINDSLSAQAEMVIKHCCVIMWFFWSIAQPNSVYWLCGERRKVFSRCASCWDSNICLNFPLQSCVDSKY